MTRVERNKKRVRVEKVTSFKETLIRLSKWLFKQICFFIVGLLYSAYLIIRYINNLVASKFMRLPRLMKVAIIYSLIFMAMQGTFNTKMQVQTKYIETPVAFVIKEEKEEEPIADKNICVYGEIECKIYNKAIELEMTKEQAILLMAISKHETGNWTSKAFKNKNNFGGVMCNTGLRTYESFEDGLTGFVNLLKNRYFGKGLNTIEEIGNVYCPVGASNDPTGVNKYWIPNVTKFYNEYLNK